MEQGLGDGEVEGGCDLDVLTVAFDKGDGMTKSLDDGGVVGEGVAEGLFIGAQQQGELKGLRGLNEAEEGAVNGEGGNRAGRRGHHG